MLIRDDPRCPGMDSLNGFRELVGPTVGVGEDQDLRVGPGESVSDRVGFAPYVGVAITNDDVPTVRSVTGPDPFPCSCPIVAVARIRDDYANVCAHLVWRRATFSAHR